MRYLMLVVVVILNSIVSAQALSATPPGIRLLPGYTERKGRPIDSIGGTISRPHGLVMGYDIGIGAGHYELDPRWTKHALWRTEQIINGKKAVCIFTKSKELLIAFPDDLTNFYAEIHSQRDLADMMLMVLTYGSQQ